MDAGYPNLDTARARPAEVRQIGRQVTDCCVDYVPCQPALTVHLTGV